MRLFLSVFQVEKECIRELEEIGLKGEEGGTFSLRAKNTLDIYSNATSFNFRVSLCVCVCVCVCGCVCGCGCACVYKTKSLKFLKSEVLQVPKVRCHRMGRPPFSYKLSPRQGPCSTDKDCVSCNNHKTL